MEKGELRIHVLEDQGTTRENLGGEVNLKGKSQASLLLDCGQKKEKRWYCSCKLTRRREQANSGEKKAKGKKITGYNITGWSNSRPGACVGGEVSVKEGEKER